MRLMVMMIIGVLLAGCVRAEPTHADVAYGVDKDQTYDVYLPASGGKGAPVMVMVHGGGWRIGDKAHRPVWQGKVAHYLPMGAVFISVNYRMLPDADVGTQALDVAAALAHIQAYGAKSGWDMSRMVVIGHSAGAHLAVLVSVDGRYMQATGVTPWLATISLDSGALDVPQIMTGRHMGLYDDAFGADEAMWPAYSPLHRITQAPMKMLLVCSSRRKYSCDQADAFSKAVAAIGGTAYALPEDMSHGDINDEVGKNAAYTAQLDDYLRHVGWLVVRK